MTPSVLHLIAVPHLKDADASGVLDAAMIGVHALDGVAVAVGPWYDAKLRAASCGVALADAFPSPVGISELAWRRIVTHWRHRQIDSVHCWGLGAARLAALSLPAVPRVVTPLEPAPATVHKRLRRTLDASRMLTLAPADHDDWSRLGFENALAPAPSLEILLDYEQSRTALGIEPNELLLVGIADIIDARRRTALARTLSKLDVARLPTTALAVPGTFARRARRIETEAPADTRMLPWRGTLPAAIAAADIACWGPEEHTSRRLASAGCLHTLVSTCLRAGLPTVIPETRDTDGLVLDEVARELRTPDASHTGAAHTIFARLHNRAEQARVGRLARRVGNYEQSTARFASVARAIYQEVAGVAAGV